MKRKTEVTINELVEAVEELCDAFKDRPDGSPEHRMFLSLRSALDRYYSKTGNGGSKKAI